MQVLCHPATHGIHLQLEAVKNFVRCNISQLSISWLMAPASLGFSWFTSKTLLQANPIKVCGLSEPCHGAGVCWPNNNDVHPASATGHDLRNGTTVCPFKHIRLWHSTVIFMKTIRSSIMVFHSESTFLASVHRQSSSCTAYSNCSGPRFDWFNIGSGLCTLWLLATFPSGWLSSMVDLILLAL